MENTLPAKNENKSAKVKSLLLNLLPVAALIVLFVIYIVIILANGYSLQIQLKRLINQAIVLVVVATGATFIYALGTFDISLGAEILFACTVGVLTYNATNSLFLMLLVIIGLGVGCSLLSAVLSIFFKIPAFVTTVAMMSVLSAASATLISVNNTSSGTASISLPSNLLEACDSIPVKIGIAAIYIIACVLIFNFLKTGRKIKFLGGNPLCARLSGIKNSKYIFVAFLLAGIGVAIGAFLTLCYTPSVSSSTAGSIGMNVLVAIVFGGMPISGGPKSRIYSSLIGGFSYMLLNQILLWLIGTNMNGIAQVISAVLFIVVVFVSSMNYRTKELPR